MRPISWPVRLVTNTLSNGKSRGKPQSFTWSAMPQRRQNSTVRMPVANILASTISPSPCSTSVHGTPRQPRSSASARPTGPPPTMRTGVMRDAGGAILPLKGRTRGRPRAKAKAGRGFDSHELRMMPPPQPSPASGGGSAPPAGRQLCADAIISRRAETPTSDPAESRPGSKSSAEKRGTVPSSIASSRWPSVSIA